MRAPGCASGASRVSIFTRPAVVWALCGPLGPSGAVSGRLEREGGMPAGRHVTPGICEEDRKHAKYIIQIWGEGRNLGISSAPGTSAIVVRVETCGPSGWITSRDTFYIIPGPIHWASSTSCPLDSTTALPSTRQAQPGSRLRPRVLPFPGISASRSPAGTWATTTARPGLLDSTTARQQY